jgi:hypothetical protein
LATIFRYRLSAGGDRFRMLKPKPLALLEPGLFQTVPVMARAHADRLE